MTGPNDDSTPDAPLEGEIIPAGYQSEQEWRNRRGGGAWRTHLLDEDDIQAIIRLRIAGVPLREIGKRYNVSYETIRKWTSAHVGRMAVRSTDVARMRAEQATQLETAREEAWKMFHGSTHPVVKAQALLRVESLTRSVSELLGLKVPVILKAEVTVTELTQEDLKAQEMIREAKAKAAATRAKVERQFQGGA